jgi:adenylate cyclase, class 2
MSTNGVEIESKFYVHDLEALEAKLIALGATCSVPRAFEYNLRFDDAQNSLQRERKVLRLRQYDEVRLTFKGPSEERGGAMVRTEFEMVVDDFEAARRFLEALGYRAIIIYEKYRAMWNLDETLITLDELPYGNFIEIEAASPEAIAHLAQKLGLNPKAAIPVNYQTLFERAVKAKNLPAKNLAFREFTGLHITAADLNVLPAD